MFSCHNTTYAVDLEVHRGMVGAGAVAEFEDVDGSITSIPIVANNIFKGRVYQYGNPLENGLDSDGRREVGWARLVVSNINSDFPSIGKLRLNTDGSFTTENRMYHIREISNYKLSKRDIDIEVVSPFSRPQLQQASNLMVFQDNPLDYKSPHFNSIRGNSGTNGHSCGNSDVDGIVFTASGQSQSFKMPGSHIFKRDATGCPVNRQLLAVGIAADCTYIAHYGGSAAALTQILSNLNQVSQVYESAFNVQIGVAKVFFKEACTPTSAETPWNRECSQSYTIATRLSDFSMWRGAQTTDSNGLW